MKIEDVIESKRIYKTERIMLVTAANLIEGLKIDMGINHALTVDSRGRILCVMHQKDNPSYRKSCRSDLEGLVEAVGRTIPQLIAEEGLEIPHIDRIRGTANGRVKVYFADSSEKIICPLDYLRSRFLRQFGKRKTK